MHQLSLCLIYWCLCFWSDLGNSPWRFGIWFKPNLMTPYLLTETPPSQRFDSAYCRTRQISWPNTSDNLPKSDRAYIIYFPSLCFKGNNWTDLLCTEKELQCTPHTVFEPIFRDHARLLQRVILHEICLASCTIRAPGLVLLEESFGIRVREHIRYTYFSWNVFKCL